MKLNRGFTLIEVIITIVVMAVAAALFVAYTGTSYTKSPTSAVYVGDQYKLIQKMEVLTSQYRKALDEGDGTITDLCAFKTSYVDNLAIDGVSIVDTANTSCTYEFTDSTGTYSTTYDALLVSLSYRGQKLQTIFTK